MSWPGIYWNLFLTTGRHIECNQFYYTQCHGIGVALNTKPAFSRKQFLLLNRPLHSKVNRRLCVKFSDQLRSDHLYVEVPINQCSNQELVPPTHRDGTEILAYPDVNNYRTLQSRPEMYKNRFLDFVRMSSVINNAAESFFKSEIRRRLFVTAVLVVFSRIGYFIPLPGFDRRLVPQDYLSFVSGSVGKLQARTPITNTRIDCEFVAWKKIRYLLAHINQRLKSIHLQATANTKAPQ